MSEYLIGYEDALFKAAVFEAAKEKHDALMQEAKEEAKPSEFVMKQFTAKLDAALRKGNAKAFWRGFRKIAARAAIAVMIFITVSFALIMSVDAMREWFTHLLLTFTPGYAEIQIQEQDSSGNAADAGKTSGMSVACLPSYIPDGFAMNKLDMTALNIDAVYMDKDGKIIDFMCYSDAATTQADTESADTMTSVTINGNPGILIEKNGQFTISWAGQDRYFVLLSQCDEKETMKIAESVPVK